ncbi:helix-turn-helix domain-containing protein [Konateibacter massiliensis]|uniref:helix-turn-helix domain-containing protein n=1 Tax=Konateibacter massiliensis TaxID=2002841 RepID=UPI000C149147|nr:helix-turn-helix transcriptional regulator [Konateibacter massiliensis]
MIYILTTQQKIKVACDVAGMSLTELGAKMGMSQANFSKRLKVGKFTQDEYIEMAKCLGCKYISCFEFPDGNKVE